MKFEPFIIVISRKEVETGDIQPALTSLQQLIASPEVARSYKEKVNIAFHGYDNDTRELFEIDEVRNYVCKLDGEFPFWLFFSSKKYLDLHALLLCFIPPYLSEEAKERIFPERIGKLLENRWFPALNYISTYAGLSKEEIATLSERTFRYISSGPIP